MHNRAQIRHARERWIARRKYILTKVWEQGEYPNYPWWGHDGSLSKNKIHCSCQYCTQKKRNQGWEHRDIKRLMHGTIIDDVDFDDYARYAWDEWWFHESGQWDYEVNMHYNTD